MIAAAADRQGEAVRVDPRRLGADPSLPFTLPEPSRPHPQPVETVDGTRA
jgi:hypothetical protein